MKYKKINNPGLGLCHIIDESNYGYLIYSENNNWHFIVTLEIRNNSFYYNRYFNSLSDAINCFNKLESEEN